MVCLRLEATRRTFYSTLFQAQMSSIGRRTMCSVGRLRHRLRPDFFVWGYLLESFQIYPTPATLFTRFSKSLPENRRLHAFKFQIKKLNKYDCTRTNLNIAIEIRVFVLAGSHLLVPKHISVSFGGLLGEAFPFSASCAEINGRFRFEANVGKSISLSGENVEFEYSAVFPWVLSHKGYAGRA